MIRDDPYHRARDALKAWDLGTCNLTLVKERENIVFAVSDTRGTQYALRLHRPGYRSAQELYSEFHWTAALNAAGVLVPQPVPTKAGELLVTLPVRQKEQYVDLLPWINATPLAQLDRPMTGHQEQVDLYRDLGSLAAQVHNQACEWQPPKDFARPSWNLEGLVGNQPLWGRFWELDTLSPQQRDLIERARVRARHDLNAYAATSEARARFSLIHADLVADNVLVNTDGIHLIDFDDGGFGWHLFELATALYFERDEPFFEAALTALIAGYREQRSLPDSQLDALPLFFLLRSFTYLGWIHERPESEAAQELTPTLVEKCCHEVERYLG